MICVSIVSHGHGSIVAKLIKKLVTFPEVSEIVVTLNIIEPIPDILGPKVKLIQNIKQKGFGENHNSAFQITNCDYFCVLNPDVFFEDNPFPELLKVLNSSCVGVTAPLVINSNGVPEDSMRKFLTPLTLLKRILHISPCSYIFDKGESSFHPDWIAGMLLLFHSETYKKIGGFDEQYFMYCEDADNCTRLWKTGYKVVGCLTTSIVHDAQRSSHKNLKYFFTGHFSLQK